MADLGASFASLGGLACVYLAMLAVGVLYALVILVGGGLGEGADASGLDGVGDVDAADALQGQFDLTHISPVTVAGFVTAFGAFGMLALSLFELSAPASLVWATLGGLLVGVASHFAFYTFLIRPQGSSEVTRRDVVGSRAEVTTPIPESGLGEVALVAQGARMTFGARSADGAPIARGSAVVIEDQLGSLVVVRPADAVGPAVG
jgi:membrane-bound ClpP family serine protease